MKTDIEIFDPRLLPVVDGSNLIKLCTGATWGEGVLWLAEHNTVIWSDIPNNRILQWDDASGMSIWRDKVNFTNGRYRDSNGDVIHCSHGGRSIQRSNASGADFETLVDNYQGRRLNSPNDIVVKSDGTLWFTDPPYGILSDKEGHKAEPELAANYVFRFDPESKALDIVTDFIEEPNGLAFSPDEKLLYISDTSAALKADGTGNHHIVVFDVVDQRSLINPRVFAEVSPGLADGFRLDRQGWVYTSSEDSIQIYHDDGTLLGKIRVPEIIANCTFGGESRNTLYIAASTSLYKITLNTQGLQ
ncbi:MAG: SMP-30/gluconolactonase/LRE family protein [Arenicella sp.]